MGPIDMLHCDAETSSESPDNGMCSAVRMRFGSKDLNAPLLASDLADMHTHVGFQSVISLSKNIQHTAIVWPGSCKG